MDKRNWEQRNSDMALSETNRDIESQRLELYEANQWADHAQREKMNLCEKVAQEIANQLKNYEESVAKKQIEPDE